MSPVTVPPHPGHDANSRASVAVQRGAGQYHWGGARPLRQPGGRTTGSLTQGQVVPVNRPSSAAPAIPASVARTASRKAYVAVTRKTLRPRFASRRSGASGTGNAAKLWGGGTLASGCTRSRSSGAGGQV